MSAAVTRRGRNGRTSNGSPFSRTLDALATRYEGGRLNGRQYIDAVREAMALHAGQVGELDARTMLHFVTLGEEP